jgi:hypothetical protein
MYYVRVIDPRETTETTYGFVTLMEDYTIDNLIQNFIKESIKRCGNDPKNILGDEGLFYHDGEGNRKPIQFFIERNEDEHLGFMVWMYSPHFEDPICCVTREDRGNNLYFYDIKGKLIRHSDLRAPL